MTPALSNHGVNSAWSDGLFNLHAAIRSQVTAALDLTDILRAALVFGVSAFDAYVHDLVLDGVAEILAGTRAPTTTFNQLKQNAATEAGLPVSALSDADIINFIRVRNELRAFQSVKAVRAAILAIKNIDVWAELSAHRTVASPTIQNQFELIMQRRHLIVHQADTLPVLAGLRNPIDEHQVSTAAAFLNDLARDIAVVSA